MNVYCCYTPDGLKTETKDIMTKVKAVMIDVSKSVWTYGRVLQAIWEMNHPFILCEHDMVPTKAQIEALKECPEPLCLSHYRYEGEPVFDTGLSKWTPHTLDWKFPHHWIGLTSWLLSHSYYRPHYHMGEVIHLGIGHHNLR